MKKLLCIIIFPLLCCSHALKGQTFGEWFNQKKTQKKYLIEQIAALEAYKSFLSKGYGIVKDGTNLIGSITRGELNLHADFFNGLKTVSPDLKQKSKAEEIIRVRNQMDQDRRQMEKLISSKDFIATQEKKRYENWYANIAEDSDGDLQDLKTLLTDGSLELEEAERIKRIEAVYNSIQEKYSQQRKFSNSLKQMLLQREQKIEQSKILRKMYGL